MGNFWLGKKAYYLRTLMGVRCFLLLSVLVAFLGAWSPVAGDDDYDDDYGDDDDADDDGGLKTFQYDVEYALTPGKWQSRGSLTVSFSQTTRHGSAKFSSVYDLTKDDTKAYNLLLANDQLY